MMPALPPDQRPRKHLRPPLANDLPPLWAVRVSDPLRERLRLMRNASATAAQPGRGRHSPALPAPDHTLAADPALGI